MKRVLETLVVFCSLLVSTYALACPNLVGHWNCTTSDGTDSSVTISDQAIPGGILYRLLDERGKIQEIPADGATHPLKDGDNTGALVATCGGDSKLDAVEKFENLKQGMNGGLEVHVDLLEPRKLISSNHLTIQYRGQPKQDITQKAICTLQ
jgi:hypothetical protein